MSGPRQCAEPGMYEYVREYPIVDEWKKHLGRYPCRYLPRYLLLPVELEWHMERRDASQIC